MQGGVLGYVYVGVSTMKPVTPLAMYVHAASAHAKSLRYAILFFGKDSACKDRA